MIATATATVIAALAIVAMATGKPTEGLTRESGVIPTLIEMAKQWGIFAALVVVFVWQGDNRERVLNERLDSQRTFVQDHLIKVLNENIAVMRAATTMMEEITRVSGTNTELLRKLQKQLEGHEQWDKVPGPG